jgi:diaminohydroxyphosphoribosylaminopyrimidine deaminase/5-amino-6-(5-phosphoribosylamino)uracil reductase
MTEPHSTYIADERFMRLALRLARRACGVTSPNPMVGAVLVKKGKLIGQGWHRQAGGPHAEIEALSDAERKGNSPSGATLYVTLEPCSTHGRTPPCTDAIVAAGIRRVVVGATDPNPAHAGRAFGILKSAGVAVTSLGAAPFGVPRSRGKDDARHPDGLKTELQTELADECARLNEAFNHWIVNRTPFVTVKAAMTLDGKIATASGESKWITGEKARDYGMKLRQGADAILVGINTVLADDPSLIFRARNTERGTRADGKLRRRIILDAKARTPPTAKVVTDEHATATTIVVTEYAPRNRVAALAKRANVVVASPAKSEIANRKSKIDLRWLLKRLGVESVTSLLVEGGGEVNASFLLGGMAHRVAFFYAPKVLGGRDARKAVAGEGVKRLEEIVQLRDVKWRRLGPDLLLTARVDAR